MLYVQRYTYTNKMQYKCYGDITELSKTRRHVGGI